MEIFQKVFSTLQDFYSFKQLTAELLPSCALDCGNRINFYLNCLKPTICLKLFTAPKTPMLYWRPIWDSDGSFLVGTLERKRNFMKSWLKKCSDTLDWRFWLDGTSCYILVRAEECRVRTVDERPILCRREEAVLSLFDWSQRRRSENWSWITRHIGGECVPSGSRLKEKWTVSSDAKVQEEK